MAEYDGVVGVDAYTLNDFIREVYQAAREEVFMGSLSCAGFNIGSLQRIDYDFASIPEVSLDPSELFRDERLSLFADPSEGAPSADADELVEFSSTASFELVANSLRVILNYDEGQAPTTLTTSLRACIEVTSDSGNMLSPKLVKLVINVQNEPTFSEILNKLLAPYLATYLTSTILTPIRIPPLGYGAVNLSAPLVRTGEGRLVVTTAMAPKPPEPAPLSGGWPDKRMFVGLSMAMLNAVIRELVPNTPPLEGSWSKTVKVWFVQSTLKADYRAKVADIMLDLVPDHPEQLLGVLAADVYVHLYAKNLGSWTGNGKVRAALRAMLEIGSNGDMVLRLVDIDDLQVDIDFHNTPAWIDGEIGNLVTALRMLLWTGISSLLATRPPTKLAQMPSFPLVVDSKCIAIAAKDVTVSTLVAPDGKRLIGATGRPSVYIVPPIN